MGKEELKSSIQQKEATLTGVDFETRKAEVEGEKGVVDENKVHEAIGAIEERIAGSSLSDRFKQKLTEKLSESTNHWHKKVDAFRTKQAEKYKEKFKTLFDQVLDAFAKFDERPEVKEIFEVVEPFFENAQQIKAIINLDAYKRRSSDWKKLNDRLALIGIDSGKIRGIQKILHIKVDGKLGPETVNVLNRNVYEQNYEVKWSDEETRHKTETPEQFGERAVEAREILDSEGWKSLELETERQLADLRKRQEGAKTFDDIERFEKEEAQIIIAAKQGKQRYIEEFRAKKEAKARAAAGASEAVVGPADEAVIAEPAQEAVAVESPVVAQAQKPSESREEKEAIEAAFTRITELFAGWKIPIATQSYISAYKAFPKEKRIPLGQIEAHFHRITVAVQGSKGNPDQVIRNNQKEIIKALGQFVNGVGGEGIRTVDRVIAQILDDHKFAEAMPKYIEFEAKKNEKERALKQSAEVFMRNVMGNGKSRPGHEDDRENYRVAYMGLIDSLRPLVVIREKFSDRFRERQDSVTVANFVPAPDEHGKVKLVEKQIPMPDTIKQYEELRGRFEAAFLTERRLYYIETGDPKYKDAFDESQQRMTDQLRGETSAALDEAGDKDKKPTGLESADAEALKTEVSSVIDAIVTEFDQLQRLQAADAMAAYHGSVIFHKKLLALKNKNPSGTKIDFAKLAKLPNVQTTFFRIVDAYDEQTTYLTVQSISQNRDVVRYQELYQDFMNQTGLFLRQVNSVFDHLKKTGEEPTELTMQDMHRWVGEIRNHPFFQNSNRYPGSRFADLKYMEIEPGSDYGKCHNLALMGIKEMVYGRNTGHEGDHIGARDYLNMVNTLGGQMLQMHGEAATFKTFVKQTGKEVAVLTAAVAGAVAMGALVAATGGLAGAGIAVVAGNLAIGAVCTGLGAAIGSQYSRAIIEGTGDHITTTAMLKAWGVGSAFSFAAGAGGTVLGTTFGRAGAAMARGSGALSQRAADAARKMGEKMIQSAKVPGATAEKGLKTQLSHLFKEFAQETREEVVEDSLQKIGEGIAPEHPWLGFTLSIIPHTSRTARATFMKSNWSFSPALGVTAQITDGGMHMKYNDVAQVRAFLEQKGAPAEALAQLDATGVVDVQAEGMRIKIEPTSEPVDARLLLAASVSSRARELEGVEFNEDTGQYECADAAARESFVKFFQAEGYIILEQNPDGSVVLERAGETVRLAAAPTVEIEADVEEKVETEPDPEIVNEIKDPDLRQKVKDLVRDMWTKTTRHFENSQYIENLGERFREIGPALKKASLDLYNILSKRLVALRRRFQKVDGILRAGVLMDAEEIVAMDPDVISSQFLRAKNLGFARKIFGIEGELTDAKIRQAYRELSLKFHPDRHRNAEQATEMFKLISGAKSTLERALADGRIDPIEEVREIGPGRFEIWSKQIVEWMDAQIAKIPDLQLRQRVSSLVADMRQAGSNMTDVVWRRVSEGWLAIGAELRIANEALWKKVDEGMQKLRVMRETLGKRPAKTDIKVEAEAATISQDTLKARKRRMNPERKEYAEVKRETDVMYIPDIHGDVQALKNSMQALGLIDAAGKWIGGNKVVQFSGDYIDRGTTNLETLDFLVDIKQQAEAAGGRVDMLMGNHEALMLGTILGHGEVAGTWLANGGCEVLLEVVEKYGSKMGIRDIAAFKEQLHRISQAKGREAFSQSAILMRDYASQFQMALSQLRSDCFQPGGRYYDLIRSWKPASQVDDVLYVHAGVSPKWSGMIRDLGVDGVNARWQQALDAAQRGDFTLFNEFNEIGKSRNGNAQYGGLFWIDFDAEIETMPEQDVKIVAENLRSRGINVVVVGHSKIKNPKLASAFEHYGIKIVASDVGMSSGYRGEGNSGKGGVKIDTSGNIVAESNDAIHTLHEAEKLKSGEAVTRLMERLRFFEQNAFVRLNAIFEAHGHGGEHFRAELAAIVEEMDAVLKTQRDPHLMAERNKYVLQLQTVDALLARDFQAQALVDELWDGRLDSEVAQGKLGHCYLIASIQALKQHPILMREVIGRSITKVAPGHWRVTFLGAPEVGPIDVTEETLKKWTGKHTSFSGAKGDMILEAAYASLRSRLGHGKAGYTKIADSKGNLPVEGGLGYRALYHFLGPSFQKHIIGKWDGISREGVYNSHLTLEEKGDAAFVEEFFQGQYIKDREGLVVTVGSKVVPGGDTKYVYLEGAKIYFSHEYTVIDYNPSTRRIKLSNPHDSARHFELSIDAFNRHFGQISYVRANPMVKLVRELETVQSPELIEHRIRTFLSTYNIYQLFNVKTREELADRWAYLINSTRNSDVKKVLLSDVMPLVERELTANN